MLVVSGRMKEVGGVYLVDEGAPVALEEEISGMPLDRVTTLRHRGSARVGPAVDRVASVEERLNGLASQEAARARDKDGIHHAISVKSGKERSLSDMVRTFSSGQSMENAGSSQRTPAWCSGE